MFDSIIEKNKDNIINSVCDLIKIPSVSEETSDPDLPFGTHCTDALNFTLNLASSMGFRVKNIDNYCGYIEFGSGDELVGIIGHLDVVPANLEDGWSTPPFSPSIRDGKIFGRGSIDDKGPVIASLYAMKAIMDTANVNKRVRLIIGLNEEKGWKCIDYYKEHEEWPSIGFSPDANFPAIYAEKGIMSLELKNNFEFENYKIINIDCKQNAINVVPKYISITLSSTKEQIDNISEIQDNTVLLSRLDDTTIKIESLGVAAHAAHPELGKNAIKQLVEFLLKHFTFKSDYLNVLYTSGLFDIESPKFMSSVKIEDESGVLTSNIASMDYIDTTLIIRINLRVPVTISLDEIKSKYYIFKNNSNNFEVIVLSTQEPLYVEKDNYLVKTLVDIFNKKAGLSSEPISIGGGTYARAFKNFISYGATMPGDQDMCHQVDEFIEIDKLILSSKIYANAIYELAK